jgi:hypothetical protein
MSLDVRFKNQSKAFKDNSHAKPLGMDQLQLLRATLSDFSYKGDAELEYIHSTIYDIISVIKDPEYNYSLEELRIVDASSIKLSSMPQIIRTVDWQTALRNILEPNDRALLLRNSDRPGDAVGAV